jgi:hypothetical protein
VGLGQDFQGHAKVIPWSIGSYQIANTALVPGALVPATLQELTAKSISFQAENHYSIKGAGLMELVVHGGKNHKGWEISTGYETSEVHRSWKIGMGYGLRISQTLSIGSSWQLASFRLHDYQYWLPEIALDFQYKSNGKIKWGGQYRHSGKTRSLSTGFSYRFTNNLQLTAELEKKSNLPTDGRFMLSFQSNAEWGILLGAEALSNTPFFGITHMGSKQIWRVGISVHPQLGSSFMLGITHSIP